MGGSLLAGVEFFDWNAAVAGDAAIAAREIEFGRDAKIDGQLILYEEEPGTLEVPERVAPEARIDRREIEDWNERRPFPAAMRDRAVGGSFGSFLMGILFVTIVATVAAALAPQTVAHLRARILDHPGRAIVAGFVGQSVLIGGGILFAMTVVGILLLPAALFAAALSGLAGYVIGAYPPFVCG